MLVRCFDSGLVAGLPFVAHVALLAYIGWLAFVVCAFGGFLLWLLPAYGLYIPGALDIEVKKRSRCVMHPIAAPLYLLRAFCLRA